MRDHPLSRCLHLAVPSHFKRLLGAHILEGHRLQELAHPEAPRKPCRATGGKYMVGSAHFVPVCHCRLLAYKERAIISQSLNQSERLAHMHFHVLQSVIVRYANELVLILDEDDLTPVYPAGSSYFLG